jgi:CO/xanthine dehydrogenase FAD-binding subunit
LTGLSRAALDSPVHGPAAPTPTAYLRPRRVEDALAMLAGRPSLAVLAGGTDLYPALVGRPPGLDVLDAGGLDALRGVAREGGRWRVGALTRWADLARDGGLPSLFDGLRQAAREVGGAQIQNAGTLGGNLCNASPAADGAPNLLALDASVELASARGGARELRLEDFLLGNRRTARRPDELLTAVLIPAPAGGEARTLFLKLGARRHLVISIVMVALALEVEAGRVARAGVAVGACAPTAVRLPLLEERIAGERLRPGLERAADAACLAPLSPIDDVRGTAAYRLDACLTLLRRGLAALAAPDRAAA